MDHPAPKRVQPSDLFKSQKKNHVDTVEGKKEEHVQSMSRDGKPPPQEPQDAEIIHLPPLQPIDKTSNLPCDAPMLHEPKNTSIEFAAQSDTRRSSGRKRTEKINLLSSFQSVHTIESNEAVSRFLKEISTSQPAKQASKKTINPFKPAPITCEDLDGSETEPRAPVAALINYETRKHTSPSDIFKQIDEKRMRIKITNQKPKDAQESILVCGNYAASDSDIQIIETHIQRQKISSIDLFKQQNASKVLHPFFQKAEKKRELLKQDADMDSVEMQELAMYQHHFNLESVHVAKTKKPVVVASTAPYPDSSCVHVGWTIDLDDPVNTFRQFSAPPMKRLNWQDYQPLHLAPTHSQAFKHANLALHQFRTRILEIWSMHLPNIERIMQLSLTTQQPAQMYRIPKHEFIHSSTQKTYTLLKQWLRVYFTPQPKHHVASILKKRKVSDGFLVSDPIDNYTNSEIDPPITFFTSQDIIDTNLHELPRLPALCLISPRATSKSSMIKKAVDYLLLTPIEIHSGLKRSGKDINAMFLDATRSHKDVTFGKRPGFWSEKGECQSAYSDDALKRVHGYDDTSDIDSDQPGSIRDARLDSESLEGNRVLIIEDVDLIFECDAGFLAALESILAKSKIPIIMTASNDVFGINGVGSAKIGEQCVCVEVDNMTADECLEVAVGLMIEKRVCCSRGVFDELFKCTDLRKLCLDVNMWSLGVQQSDSFVFVEEVHTYLASENKHTTCKNELDALFGYLDSQSTFEAMFDACEWEDCVIDEETDKKTPEITCETIAYTSTRKRTPYKDLRSPAYPVLFARSDLDAMNARVFPCNRTSHVFTDKSHAKLLAVNELYFDFDMISRRKEIMVEAVPYLKNIAVSMLVSTTQDHPESKKLRKKSIVTNTSTLTNEELTSESIRLLVDLRM